MTEAELIALAASAPADTLNYVQGLWLTVAVVLALLAIAVRSL